MLKAGTSHKKTALRLRAFDRNNLHVKARRRKGLSLKGADI
jgi:hypothetical protein